MPLALPLQDTTRLAALAETGLLDTPAEESFDRLTRMVSRLLDVPVALVSLVDDSRQFFKSAQGLREPVSSARETPLTHSFCQHVVVSAAPLVVEDAHTHPLVSNNLAVCELGVAAYLGVPLTTPTGHVLGSLCAIDTRPRFWSHEQIETLGDVAEIVMREIALRKEIVRREKAEKQQHLLIGELHHRMKNTLSVIHALISLSLRSADSLESFSKSISGRIASLAATHSLLIDQQWLSVSLRDLLDNEIRPYDGSHRIVTTGPDVQLPSYIAVAIGMSVHELITNAIKHGALSAAKGLVHLSWTAEPAGDGVLLVMEWTESGGPAVAMPTRRGFGSLLFERVLIPQLNGKITRDFHPDGLRVRIESLAVPET